MIKAIHHVDVTIPFFSEDIARNFYCNILGLKEIEKPENLKQNGGLWLEIGNTQLHLGCENNDNRSKTKSHIAYEVTDLEAWKAKFKSLDIKINENTPINFMNRFDARDPFGNRIEFIKLK